MFVKCKFYVGSIEQSPYGGWSDVPKTISYRVRMSAVSGEPFGTLTPNGSVDMLIINQEAAKYFELEGEYEVIFKRVEKASG